MNSWLRQDEVFSADFPHSKHNVLLTLCSLNRAVFWFSFRYIVFVQIPLI